MCFTSKSALAIMAVLVILTIENGVYGAVFTQQAISHPGKYTTLNNEVCKRLTLVYLFSFSWKMF